MTPKKYRITAPDELKTKMAASKTGDKRSIEKEKEMASADDSSDSESEPEPAKIFHRRISTNKDIRTSVLNFISAFTTVYVCH